MESYNFIYAYFFVLVALVYIQRVKLGIHKELFISTIRGFVQLFLLSFVLLYLFESENRIYTYISIIIMLIFASITAKFRIKYLKRPFLVPFLAISIPTLLVLISLVAVGALEQSANVLIPISGMVIGNALNSYTIAIDRFKSDIANTYPLIEASLSLGIPLNTAINDQKKDALKSSLHPIINNLQTLGIVFIPGMMSGLLIAGATPTYALSMQMMIMYIIVAVSLGSALLAISLTYREFLISKRA